ncbi:putative leader peptide [Nocardioides thalensis]
MDTRLAIRDADWVRDRARPRVMPMPRTLLTKRRAVDNCRVASALCRMR